MPGSKDDGVPLYLQPLPWRAIQIGLGPAVVGEYVDDWIVGIALSDRLV